MAQKKYVGRAALAQRLRRDGFRGPEALATLLLDLRFELDWVLPAKLYDKTSYAIPGINYRAWIQKLMKLGYLNPKEIIANPKDHITYTAGHKLTYYINREKEFRTEMASIRDVVEHGIEIRTETNAKVDALQAEVKSVRLELNHTKNELGFVKSDLGETKAAVANLGKRMEAVYEIFDLGEPDPPDYPKFTQLTASKSKVTKVKQAVNKILS